LQPAGLRTRASSPRAPAPGTRRFPARVADPAQPDTRR
jgi:hypothetical protein